MPKVSLTLFELAAQNEMILHDTYNFTDDEDKVSSTDDAKPESEQEAPPTVTKPVATTTAPSVGLFGE